MAKQKATTRRKQDYPDRYKIHLQGGKEGLVEATSKMDIQEFRVFATMLTMVLPDDEDFTEYEIRVQDIIKLFGLNKDGRYYEIIRDASQRMMDRKFVIYEDKGGKEYRTTIHLIDETSVPTDENNQNHIRLKFNPKLKPYLLQLKREYLTIDVRNLIHIQSPYSIKLYMILKHQQNLGNQKVKYTVERLRQMLAVEDDEYPMYGNFKQKVILKAVGDIEKHTDLTILKIEEIKVGRAVGMINFHIEAKEQQKHLEIQKTKANAKRVLKTGDGTEKTLIEDANAEIEDANFEELPVLKNPDEVFIERIYEQVKNYKITQSTVEKWVREIPKEQIESGVNHVLAILKSGKTIKNIGGYLNQMVTTVNLFNLNEQIEAEAKVQLAKKNQQEVKQKKKDQADLRQEQDKLLNELSEVQKNFILDVVQNEKQLFADILAQLKAEAQSEKPNPMNEIAWEGYQTASKGDESKEALLQYLKEGSFIFYGFVAEYIEKRFPEEYGKIKAQFQKRADSLGMKI